MFATQMYDSKMFEGRENFAAGQGTSVLGAKDIDTVAKLAGMTYKGIMVPTYIKAPTDMGDDILVPDSYAIVRDDNPKAILCKSVSGQYKILQNDEAFAMVADLAGEGMIFETAGYFGNGERSWILGKLPETYNILGDEVVVYIVMMNSFDGTCAVKFAITPIRVWCSNTLNMALKTAERKISLVHKRSITSRIEEVRMVLGLTDTYMASLNKQMETLAKVKLSPITLEKIVLPNLIKIDEDKMSARQIETRMEQRAELRYRYLNAPDLSEMPKTGYRFINAVADYVDHTEPGRETKNWRANRFKDQIEGNKLLDEAAKILLSVA